MVKIYDFAGKKFQAIGKPYISHDGTTYKVKAVEFGAKKTNKYLLSWEIIYPEKRFIENQCDWDQIMAVENLGMEG